MRGLNAKIHKWLALLMALQILFWFASGLFFAIVPIERVRSEHAMAEARPQPVALNIAAAGLERLAGQGVRFGEKVEVRSLLGRPVALVSGGEARPALFDLATGQRLSPLPASLAVRVAEADLAGRTRAVRVEQVTANTAEYGGAVPAWRVDFAEGTNRSLYVAADTGLVAARRSTLWRAYDFLWRLHIMDYRGAADDFNSPLLVIATALATIVLITGIILFPSRLGYTAWRRRRRALRDNGGGATNP